MFRRIMLSGVHGVGKGHLINTKLALYENLRIISASAIISQYHDAEDAGNKRVKNVADNQKILQEALMEFFSRDDEIILLDGHLVILDSEDVIQRIPISFFEKGMFDTLILLQDDPNLIYDRLYKRDGIHKLDLNMISEIQEQEKRYARELEMRGVDVCYLSPLSDESSYRHLFVGEYD